MAMQTSKVIKYYLPAVLSGVFIGTSYIPFPPWAVFFAFVPLWNFIVEAKSLSQIIKASLITQFLLSIIGFFWVTNVAMEHGHLPASIALLALIFFSLTAMYYIPLSGLLWFFINKKLNIKSHFLKILTLALITAILEITYPTIFQWNYAYTFLWAKLPIYQLSDIIGFNGMSSLVILSNVLFYFIWKNRKNKTKSLKHLFAFIFVFAILNIWGSVKKNNLPPPDKKTNIQIVQANIGNQEKVMAESGWGFRGKILDTYKEVTLRKFDPEKVDFTIWPETAFPERFDKFNFNKPLNSQLIRFIKKHKIDLLTGTYYQHPDGISNALYFFKSDGTTAAEPYFKTILLAFGEYLPFAEQFPILHKWLPQVATFKRGTGPKVKTVKGLNIGPQICYESLFPEFSKALADQGAQVIVNITNDSWYGAYSEPYQHLYMTLARAIEFRIPVVRSTNTGISAVILANGDVLAKSPLFKKWTHIYEVPYLEKSAATFYSKNLNLILYLLLFSLLVTLLIIKFGNKNEK